MTADNHDLIVAVTPLSWQAEHFRARRKVFRSAASLRAPFTMFSLFNDVSNETPLRSVGVTSGGSTRLWWEQGIPDSLQRCKHCPSTIVSRLAS